MLRISFSQTVLLASFLLGTLSVSAQSSDDWGFPEARGRRNNDDEKVVKDMLAKQRSAKEKKEHEEMVERAEKALALSEEINASLEKNENLGPSDQKRLAELEKLVLKIRGDLGGSDDDRTARDEKDNGSLTLRESFLLLRDSTVKMADEIKKTTRYSISVVAIESSNAVIKIVRFLRLRS